MAKYKNLKTPNGDEIVPANTDKENTPEQSAVRNKEGMDFYCHHRFLYILFCRGWGYVICIIAAQFIMQPVLRTSWADDFATQFNIMINASPGSGASKGVLCNICAIVLIIINLIIRHIFADKFSKAKEYEEMLRHQKNGE